MFYIFAIRACSDSVISNKRVLLVNRKKAMYINNLMASICIFYAELNSLVVNAKYVLLLCDSLLKKSKK